MGTSQNPLAPIPKIWIPAVVALIVILFSWIFSGDFAEAELAALLVTIGYFVLGYALPGESASGERPRREHPAERRARQEAQTRQFDFE
ncbi:MAG TPA: hypothetical protein VGR10_05060 [Thermoleophilaceae bacterium]|nr:hypothetical protein [Thermoleophilaceae bacterium]